VTEGVGTEAIRVGTAMVSYIEPHAGLAREFNRWYERDHFPAAVLAGPGVYSGARFVATRACKGVRLPVRLFGDPAVGSYLSLAWFLPDAHAGWNAWVGPQMETIVAEGRMFAGRDHLHTAVYEYEWAVGTDEAPPAAFVLDRRFPGVAAIAIADGGTDVERWAREIVAPDLPIVVALRRQHVLVSVLDDVEPHSLVLAFIDGDVIDVWRRRIEPALATLAGVGFASPFLATVPGTDTYVDDL
jgi:hypothetical protein